MSGNRQPQRFIFRGQLSPIVREMFEDLERQQKRERRRKKPKTERELLEELHVIVQELLAKMRKQPATRRKP